MDRRVLVVQHPRQSIDQRQHIEVRPYRSVLTAQHAARACTRPKAWVSPPARIPPAIELPRRTYAAPPACRPSARRRDVGYMANFTGGFEVRCKRAEPKIALEPSPLPSRLRRRRKPRKPDQRVRCGVQTISCATGTWREPRVRYVFCLLSRSVRFFYVHSSHRRAVARGRDLARIGP